MRIAAAIQWYHQTLISQAKAAEIAGLSRADFLDALFRANVPASQVTIDELKEELESWQRPRRWRKLRAVGRPDRSKLRSDS
jgi:predicted HTH domain antitoxin